MLKKIGYLISITAVLVFTISICAYAGGIESSTLFSGTEKLVGDATTALTGLVIIITIFFGVKNCIAWSTADDQEKPKYKKMLIQGIGIGVLGSIISGLITIILGYYK